MVVRYRGARLAAAGVLLVVLSAGVARAEACRLRFDQSTTGLPTTCVFVGRVDPTCGGEVMALFAGDGRALVLSLTATSVSSPLFMPARVLSATEGRLVLWRDDLDLDIADSAGSVHLEAHGQRLRLRIAGGELAAGGCRFNEFVGHFRGLVASGGAPAPTARRAALAP